MDDKMNPESQTKPNLKIYVDNSGGKDSDSELSDEREDVDEKLVDSNESDSDNNDNGRKMTLNVDVGDKKRFGLKTYSNKAGEFVTGFDPTSEEFQENKKQRAKRFGIETSSAPLDKDQLQKLYHSLGVNGCDNQKDERGIRLEAIHIRGVDDLTTEDVFEYFQEFPPGSIEWIDDTSCNVVWLDSITAARAMLHLAHKPEDNNDSDGVMKTHKNRPASTTPSEQSMETDEPQEQSKNSEARKDSTIEETEDGKTRQSKDQETDKTMDDDDMNSSPEDDDRLDLRSSDEEDTADTVEKSDKQVKDDQSRDSSRRSKRKLNLPVTEKSIDLTEPTDTQNTLSDDSKDNNSATDHTEIKSKEDMLMPPGKWWIGLPHPKAQYIWFRFTNKADKKRPGAANKSKFYQKYGNPNFGGLKGVISESRKQRMRTEKRRQDWEEAKRAVKKTEKLYHIPEETAFDRHTKTAIEARFSARDHKSESEESDDDDFDIETEVDMLLSVTPEKTIKRSSPLPTKTLKRSSPVPAKKRTMRMYADDMEDQLREKRLSGSSGTSRIADARDRLSGRVGDRVTYTKHDDFAFDEDSGESSEDETEQQEEDFGSELYEVGDLRNRLERKRRNPDSSCRLQRLTVQFRPDST